MFAHDLHLLLALASLAVMALVAGEGAVRLVVARPPGRLAAAGSGTVTILLAMTSAGGLALLLGGHRPTEWLHLLYALLAFGLVPLADSLTVQASPRRRALARLLGGLVAVAVTARLFATG